jgi:hypothetical protein
VVFALSQFFNIFVLEYVIRKAQESKEGLEVNGAHQFLACADEVMF